MADIFDQIAEEAASGSRSASMAVTDSYAPGAASSGDIFDQIAAEAANHSETRAVLNDALKGAGGFLGLVDEFNPISVGDYGPKLSMPPLFGLGTPRKEKFADLFTRVAKDYGVMTEDKPITEKGKFLGNAAEAAASTIPFGPMAALVAGLTSGTGGYFGEKIGEVYGNPQAGRYTGQFFGGVTPTALSKLNIVKEIGEALGPTVSQFPLIRSIFRSAPIDSAVGRAITEAASDPIATEKALEQAVSQMGPTSKLNSLKTTAEIAGDSGLARAEDAVQNAISSAPFKSIAEERAAVRAGDVLKNYDPNVSNYDVSKGLEATIAKSAESLAEVEQAAWKAVPKDTAIYTKTPGMAEDLANAVDDITYSGAISLEGEGAGLLKQFENATSEGVVSFDVVQKLRSRALEVLRATASGGSAAERASHKVAGALEEHLRNIVDNNVQIGAIPEEAANLWQQARGATSKKISTFGASKVGSANAGTKGLEQVGLRGQSLDNTTLLKEGLNSPDKLAAHLQAAAAGGEDVKPLYQQALKAELDGKPQSQWANIIDRKRTQWEQFFLKMR